jgi:hypothetical protein
MKLCNEQAQELAQASLIDQPQQLRDRTSDLAAHIRQAIDDWIECERAEAEGGEVNRAGLGLIRGMQQDFAAMRRQNESREAASEKIPFFSFPGHRR